MYAMPIHVRQMDDIGGRYKKQQNEGKIRIYGEESRQHTKYVGDFHQGITPKYKVKRYGRPEKLLEWSVLVCK